MKKIEGRTKIVDERRGSGVHAFWKSGGGGDTPQIFRRVRRVCRPSPVELPSSECKCARGVRVRVCVCVQCGCACALSVWFRACLRRHRGQGRRCSKIPSVGSRRFNVFLLWRMPWQCKCCIVQKQKDLIKNLPLSHARYCHLSSFHNLFLTLCATYAHRSHRRKPTSI